MNGILKCEYGLDRVFATKAQSRKAVEQALQLYGTRRPHSALSYQFPAQVHAQGISADFRAFGESGSENNLPI